MTYNIKKRKGNKDVEYNNSSRRFRPLGSRFMALSIKCDFLALRTVSPDSCSFTVTSKTKRLP